MLCKITIFTLFASNLFSQHIVQPKPGKDKFTIMPNCYISSPLVSGSILEAVIGKFHSFMQHDSCCVVNSLLTLNSLLLQYFKLYGSHTGINKYVQYLQICSHCRFLAFHCSIIKKPANLWIHHHEKLFGKHLFFPLTLGTQGNGLVTSRFKNTRISCCNISISLYSIRLKKEKNNCSTDAV